MMSDARNSCGMSCRGWGMLGAILLLSQLVACGGGGGGGGDGVDVTDDPAPPLPSRVNYVAGGPGGNSDTTGMRLLVDGALAIDATFYLTGSYVPATQLYTLTLSPVPRFVISATSPGFELPIIDSSSGKFGLLVNETLQWKVGEHPTAGSFRVIAANYIEVAVNNDIDGMGTPGVDVALVEFEATSASASLSWDQFEATLNNAAAPTYLREAALAYLTLQRVYQPLQGVVQNFTAIAQQENALEAAGSGSTVSVPLCSTLNASTGTYNLTWTDGPGDIAGALGSGDDFGIDVNNCWIDNPATSNDQLYVSGQMQLATYGESTTPFVLGADDVTISDLLLTETHQAAGGVVNQGSSSLFNSFSSVTGRNGFYLELTPDVSGTLNLVNVVQVAEATAATLSLPGELGNSAVDLLANALAGSDLAATVNCPFGGSYDYVLSAKPFVANATMEVTFNDCVQGTVTDQSTINGSYVLTATAYTSTDDMQFTLAIDKTSIQDSVGLSVIDGQMAFQRLVTGGTTNELSTSVSGKSLSVEAKGVTASLANFSLSGTRSATGVTLGAPGETFDLQLSTLSDPLAGEIGTSFSGPDALDLQAGSVRVTAADNSNLLLTITDANGTVSLDLDSDGNGSAEDTVATKWDDLN